MAIPSRAKRNYRLAKGFHARAVRGLLLKTPFWDALGMIQPINVRAIREGLKMTQQGFATKFGLNLATLRDWEHDRYSPTGPARVLLIVIERQPDAVVAALNPPIVPITAQAGGP
jgi:DNA-binding transcriptional regulator YiaG